jgi:hypothetical protein
VGPDGDEAAIAIADTRVNRLRWMQEHTLGCVQTFEHRRTELALLQGELREAVSDATVLEHLLADVSALTTTAINGRRWRSGWSREGLTVVVGRDGALLLLLLLRRCSPGAPCSST